MHFTILVVGDDPKKQMEPFQEAGSGSIDQKYLEFEDVEDEMKKEWDDNKPEIPDWFAGNRITLSAKDYKTLKTEGLVQIIGLSDSFMLLKEGERRAGHYRTTNGKLSQDLYFDILTCIKREEEREDGGRNFFYDVTFRKIPKPKNSRPQERYPSFESFVKNYHGHEERDTKTNRFGYWNNPNGNWDWYVIGGRWMGYFTMKAGKYGTIGRSGSGGNAADYDADRALKGDIDWKRMETIRKESAEKDWEAYHNHVKNIKASKRTKEEKRNELQCLASQYDCGKDKEKYISERTNFATFAILKDGEWKERELNEDREIWDKTWQKILDSVPNNKLLTLIDYHT